MPRALRPISRREMGRWATTCSTGSPLWQYTQRTVVDVVGKLSLIRITLPPLTVHQLDNVAGPCKERVGMGIDGVHPGSVLWLPVDLKQRFVDILNAWESCPVKPVAWANLMTLQDKPEGGHRTMWTYGDSLSHLVESQETSCCRVGSAE